MLKFISIKSILTLLAFTNYLTLPAEANAGLITSWFSGSPKEKEQHPNPCEDSLFLAQNSRYCSGFFSKEIRCLSDGKNPGVCDSAAVCNTENQIAKVLCENHCLNTAPQKLGNQFIQINCTPRYETDTAIDLVPETAPDGEQNWSNEIQGPQSSSQDNYFHGPMGQDIQEIEIQSIGNDDQQGVQARLFLTSSEGSTNEAAPKENDTDVIANYPAEENAPVEHASKSHEEAKQAELEYKKQLFQAFHWHTPD